LLGIDARAARATWTAALVLLLLGAVYLIRQTLLIFVIALLFAYLLYPLMDLIDRKLPSKTRTPALALTYVLVLGFLAAFAIPIGSVVGRQAANLASAAPAFLARLQQTPSQASPPGVASLRNLIADAVRQHYGELISVVPRMSLRVLSASWNLIYVVIVPILSFFILKDGRRIRDSFLEHLDGGREAAEDTLMDVHHLLLHYMRALLFLCCAVFITFTIVLSAMRVPYALLLASVAFALEFVPMVGPLTAAVIIVAVSAVGGYPHIVLVILFLGLYRLFQDYALSPHLMSQGVEMHPLMIIFGVFAGGELGGVAGVFLSIPTLALLRLLYHQLVKIRAARRLQPVGS
jgi:predicted PurR-regulated permease PerM